MMEKSKSLFDHFAQLTHLKQQNYWDNLSEGDKKSFSQFMLNRFLSMDLNYVELVSYIQNYKLPDEMYERVMREFIPKKKIYNKYLKGKKDKSNVDIDILSEHLKVSKREAIEYYDTLKSNKQLKQIKDIKKLYGQRFEKS